MLPVDPLPILRNYSCKFVPFVFFSPSAKTQNFLSPNFPKFSQTNFIEMVSLDKVFLLVVLMTTPKSVSADMPLDGYPRAVPLALVGALGSAASWIWFKIVDEKTSDEPAILMEEDE